MTARCCSWKWTSRFRAWHVEASFSVVTRKSCRKRGGQAHARATDGALARARGYSQLRSATDSKTPTALLRARAANGCASASDWARAGAQKVGRLQSSAGRQRRSE